MLLCRRFRQNTMTTTRWKKKNAIIIIRANDVEQMICIAESNASSTSSSSEATGGNFLTSLRLMMSRWCWWWSFLVSHHYYAKTSNHSINAHARLSFICHSGSHALSHSPADFELGKSAISFRSSSGGLWEIFYEQNDSKWINEKYWNEILNVYHLMLKLCFFKKCPTGTQ